jgi:hypothetical protein
MKIEKQMRIKKESIIFNSVNQKTSKVSKGERKESNCVWGKEGNPTKL